MQNFLRNSGYPRFCAFFRICFLIILTLSPGAARLAAQQKKALAPQACVPSNLAATIVPEGRSVRVNSVEEPSFHNPTEAADLTLTPKDVHARAEAYWILEREALRGSVTAQVNLAVASLAGWGGGSSDPSTALYWLHAAAEKGYAPALFDLGILYAGGCGVRQDYGEAFRFFQAAATSGDTAASVDLGYLYDRGLGVAQDHSAAARWYRQAAERGEPRAQYNLADHYLRGEGVLLDESLAFTWFQKAAVQGHTGARIMLGSLFAAGRGTVQDLQSAYLWIAAASLQGDPRGDATLKELAQQLSSGQLRAARLQAQVMVHRTSSTHLAARLE